MHNQNINDEMNFITKVSALLILSSTALAAPPFSLDTSLGDMNMGLVEKGQELLKGNESLILRDAWNRPDKSGLKTVYGHAMHGNMRAATMMGVVYDTGRWGVTKSPERALRWFNVAAKKGDIIAIYDLGVLYATGRTTDNKPDQDKAMFAMNQVWKAKNLAIPQAGIRLAYNAYDQKNFDRAWKICQVLQYAQQRYVSYLMGRMRYEGSAPEGRNEHLAIEDMQSALTHGNIEAAKYLSWLYSSGDNRNDKMALVMSDIVALYGNGTSAGPAYGDLTDDDRRQAEASARNQVTDIKNAKGLDFTDTLTGLETWLP
jgi:TPR repeat protein